MLLFRSEENIQAWCQKHHLPQGQILSLAQVWQLSQRWYADRLSENYTARSPQQIEALFEQVGLTSTFWDL